MRLIGESNFGLLLAWGMFIMHEKQLCLGRINWYETAKGFQIALLGFIMACLPCWRQIYNEIQVCSSSALAKRFLPCLFVACTQVICLLSVFTICLLSDLERSWTGLGVQSNWILLRCKYLLPFSSFENPGWDAFKKDKHIFLCALIEKLWAAMLGFSISHLTPAPSHFSLRCTVLSPQLCWQQRVQLRVRKITICKTTKGFSFNPSQDASSSLVQM